MDRDDLADEIYKIIMKECFENVGCNNCEHRVTTGWSRCGLCEESHWQLNECVADELAEKIADLMEVKK